jgi:signal-transduction protein with cAMP-binding, CBS, and nucleotidyltransferase domain
LTPDLTMLALAILGLLFWQAATAVEERSARFRQLERTPIRDIARTRSLKAPSWTSVARFRSQHPALGRDTFIVITQDGYDTGAVAPEDLYSVPADEARYVSLGQMARPITYVDSLRLQDPVLEVYLRFLRKRPAVLSVLDNRGALAGIITRSDVEQWVNNPSSVIRRAHEAASTYASTAARELAA